MTPSFTRGEYWLLEAAADFRVPIDWVAARNVAEILNKPGSHGLSRASLIQTLTDLFRRGLIEAIRSDGRLFFPDRDELIHGMDRPPADAARWWYGLTADGGRQWESFAQPHWERFIEVSYPVPHGDEAGEAEYVCADKERLARYFELAKQVLKVIDPSSARWDLLKPWQATYWKLLPAGHRVQFRGCSDVKRFPRDPWQAMCDMDRWYAWG